VLAPSLKMCEYSRLDAMDIQVESNGKRRVVRIKDKITLDCCPQFESSLESVLQAEVNEIVLDFAEVPFIDSSGIGEILRLFKKMRDRDGELILINPNRKLQDLFKMYRFEKFMTIRAKVAAGRE